MAQGETTFSTEGRKTVKFVSTPLPTNVDYNFKLNGDAEIRQADGVGKLPRIAVSMDMLGTATKDGGKDRKVFVDFHLNLAPGKDGVAMVDRGNGIVAFAKSIGDVMAGITIKDAVYGEEEKPVQILSPKGVLAWLKAHEGATGQVRLRLEKDLNGEQRNRVAYFIEQEEVEGGGDDEGEDANVGDETGEDEEEAPAPPPKAAAKPLPAAKGKTHGKR